MKDIDKILGSLTSEEKKYLLNKLKADVLGNISKEITTCLCCNDTNFMKHGMYKGVQKYKCRNTSKIFSYKSRTIISGITMSNLHKLEAMMDYMIEKNFPTLQDIANRLRISIITAHDWRTKVLTALYKHIDFTNQIVEFDETNVRLSRKGRRGMEYSRKRGGKLVGDSNYNVKVFMTYSRGTNKLELYASHMGRSSARDVANYMDVNKGVVMLTDKHNSYKSYCNKNGVVQKTFKSKDYVSKLDKTVHNQTVNYYTKRLKNFIDKELMGVSTKYLQGYLNWIMFIDNAKKESASIKEVVMENKVALDIYKQKEKEFQYFLKINGRNNYGTYKDRYYGRVS